MKDRWKFCQCCYLNGHCENQDRDMKCETYPKQLEDKVELLQEQLNEANEALKKVKEKALSVDLSGLDYDNRHKMYDIMFTDGIIDSYLEKWGVK